MTALEHFAFFFSSASLLFMLSRPTQPSDLCRQTDCRDGAKQRLMKRVNKDPWSFVTFSPNAFYLNSTGFIFKLTLSLMPTIKYEVNIVSGFMKLRFFIISTNLHKRVQAICSRRMISFITGLKICWGTSLPKKREDRCYQNANPQILEMTQTLFPVLFYWKNMARSKPWSHNSDTSNLCTWESPTSSWVWFFCPWNGNKNDFPYYLEKSSETMQVTMRHIRYCYK